MKTLLVLVLSLVVSAEANDLSDRGLEAFVRENPTIKSVDGYRYADIKVSDVVARFMVSRLNANDSGFLSVSQSACTMTKEGILAHCTLKVMGTQRTSENGNYVLKPNSTEMGLHVAYDFDTKTGKITGQPIYGAVGF